MHTENQWVEFANGQIGRGIINSDGAYQEFYSSALLSNMSASSISWIGTIQGCLLEIVGIFVGPIYDRGYFHALIYTGSLLVVVGTMALSVCTTYWQVLLAQGICVGLGSGIVFVPSVSVVTASFNKHRAIAIGVVSSASSVGELETLPVTHIVLIGKEGGVIYPIAFRQLQPKVGFAWATRIMGFIALATFLMSFAAFWRPTTAKGQKTRSLVDMSAIRELPFMLYILALTVLYAGYFVPFFYAPTYATQHLGTNADLAFYLLAILNSGAFLGRLLPGLLPRFLARVEVLLLSTAAAGLLVLAWIGVEDVGGFVGFSIIFGIASGVIITMATVMVPVLAPPGAVQETIGTRLGMSYFGAGIGILVGSPIAGAASKTAQGDFKGAQIFGGLTLLAGAAIMIYPWITIRRQRRKPT
ncbi:MAG: hypothetical protein LQ350_004701 [Teloschistes chrysophthalmus]|nr:MAG: hypothetical protein LQ350_004701 [Niorma chrysophthalma]